MMAHLVYGRSQQDHRHVRCRRCKHLVITANFRRFAARVPTRDAPVYGRFTEGFETSDLKVAKSLIDKLM